MRALAQHRFGEVKALAHGSFHRAAMCFVKGMSYFSHRTFLQHEATVTGGRAAVQSIVPSVQHKKIYCKGSAYQ
jgi:hypothetical protein